MSTQNCRQIVKYPVKQEHPCMRQAVSQVNSDHKKWATKPGICDPWVTYGLYTLARMRQNDLLKLLASMDQTVAKRKPSRLELFGAAVTLLL